MADFERTRSTPSTIYLVTVSPTEPGQHLVQARSRAAALTHVAKAIMKAEKPPASQLVALGASGIKVEIAAAEAEGEP